MSLLTVYNANGTIAQVVHQPAVITQQLAALGVGFFHCPTDVILPPDAPDEAILAAHHTTIEDLKQQHGYTAVDVVRMRPENPYKADMRKKFLAEHTHNDDEVRLFTEGSGLFTLHINNVIYALTCTAGDLIRLPAGIKHWFDMGEAPLFTAIRLFTSPEGWVGNFTGSAIALDFPPYTPAVQAIVTDIEGTTSSISFVHSVLFPYARQHLTAYVQNPANTAQVQPIFAQVAALVGQDLTPEQCTAQLLAWLNADAKITPLKTLQGLIWQQGYADGALTSDVYPDALAALQCWHAMGKQLYVYSSGSIAAQKLLFGHTAQGDITPLFSGFFDTTTGAKNALMSYVSIAQQLCLPPPAILFLSDSVAEITAATAAGMRTVLIQRQGDCVAPALSSFKDVVL